MFPVSKKSTRRYSLPQPAPSVRTVSEDTAAQNRVTAPPVPARSISFEQMQIHYSTPAPAMTEAPDHEPPAENSESSSLQEQKQEQEFEELLTAGLGSPENWTDIFLEKLGVTAEAAEMLKGQHMNFNEMNAANMLPGDKPNIFGKKPDREATFNEFLSKQLELIKSESTESELIELLSARRIPLMQMGAVLNGISLMLARKLGDMGASNHILQKIIERLFPPAAEGTDRHRQQEEVSAFAQRNPVLMYLHNEANSHDASVMLLQIAQSLGVDRKTAFDLVKNQARIQIMAMINLKQHGLNVHALRTFKLSIDDAAGLYSENFLKNVMSEKDWSPKSNADIKKLWRKFSVLAENAQVGKYPEGTHPALAKATRHGNKALGTEEKTQALMQKAIDGVKYFINSLNITTEKPPVELLNEIIARIHNAPIIITRFASDLLSRELSPDQTREARALKAGTPVSYITLDELLTADKEIRYHRPVSGESPEIAAKYILARSNSSDSQDIPYTALLSQESEEGKERGISYPIFRSNKNRLFAGKQQNAPHAIFGTLDLPGILGYQGLNNYGRESGTYGDVVLVFKKNILQNYMYTFGDRMRGYTDLTALVYNAFAMWGDFMHSGLETLIPGGDTTGLAKLARNLILLVLGQPNLEDGFESLEVQIFEPLKLTKEYIDRVYFATTVQPEQIAQIKAAILDTSFIPREAEQSQDTVFYQYVPYEVPIETPLLPMMYLYKKTDQPGSRKEMDINDVLLLLDTPDYESILTEQYGFHKQHSWKSRTPEEKAIFQKILQWFNNIREYKREHPDIMKHELENIIYGKQSLPRKI